MFHVNILRKGITDGIDLKETMEMEDQETGYGELHLHLDGAITPRIAKKAGGTSGDRTAI